MPYTPPTGLYDPFLAAADDAGAPAVRRAVRVTVYRVNVTEGDGESDPGDVGLEELPNVACVAVEERMGAVPATAMFRYKFDGRDPASPPTVEAAISTAFSTADYPHLVEVGDRLAVFAWYPDGSGGEWLFDGFPLTWRVRLDRGEATVVMAALGVEKRLWDLPAGGAVMRDSDEPEAVNDVPTDLVAQFNPRGAPNACPSTAESGEDPFNYPVFMDPDVKGTDTDGVPFPRSWTLPMACAYLFYAMNDELWVSNPKRSVLDEVLVGREPVDGAAWDPTDPSTYTAVDLIAADTPINGRAWPELVDQVVKNSGFGTAFVRSSTAGGNPRTDFSIFLKQAGTPKPLLLQRYGDTFDATASNLAGFDGARDLSGVVNGWKVSGGLARIEASFVLAPAFPSQSSDSATAAALAAYDLTASGWDTTAAHDAYRLFLFDEGGEVHYAINSTTAVTGTATSLDAIFGAPVDDVPQYTKRRRVPLGKLFSVDSNGDPLPARLSISTSYGGASPGLWVGGTETGTGGYWQRVEGQWELLEDRIGIWINCKNPNVWNVGKCDDAHASFPDGKVPVVECMGNPTGGTKHPGFTLRLTCVIEADRCLAYVAEPSGASPLEPEIFREVDARDRLVYRAVGKNSEFNNTSSSVVVRDDTNAAKAEAVAARTATECGLFEGEARLDRLTTAYALGDRISEIKGRDLSLRTDNGGSGMAPVLPVVVARRWELEGGQRTYLALSDSGVDRRRYSLWSGGSR
jgi:hypothetical protein